MSEMTQAVKKKIKGTAGAALAGAMLLTSGAYAYASNAPEPTAAADDDADGKFTVRQADSYDKVANVAGEFAYTQDTVTPSDEVFNLFGTAVTGLCAKPVDSTFEEPTADYYVNVGGDIKKAYTVNLKDLEEQSQEKIVMCACGMGAATANVQTRSIDLADVITLTDVSDDANVLKVTGSDNYTATLPLRYALDNEAMIVYQINGEDMPCATQFWVPNTVAKYFVRDVVDIEVVKADEVPEVEGRDAELAAEINIVNRLQNAAVPLGSSIAFEGYADDLGSPVTSIEFSLDGGETWSSYDVDATTDRWVHWNFAYTPEEAGTYELTVRAVTEDGTVSPLAASTVFSVL